MVLKIYGKSKMIGAQKRIIEVILYLVQFLVTRELNFRGGRAIGRVISAFW